MSTAGDQRKVWSASILMGGKSMQELEPTWSRAISVWWLIFWRGIVGAALIGGVVGFVIGFIGALAGVDAAVLTIVNGAIGLLIGTIWMIYAVRMALRKRYGGFRLALVPLDAVATKEPTL
jgi:hypothetical protein